MLNITKSNTNQSKSIISNLSLHDHEQPQLPHTFKLHQQFKHQNNSYFYQYSMINKQNQHNQKAKPRINKIGLGFTHFVLEGRGISDI